MLDLLFDIDIYMMSSSPLSFSLHVQVVQGSVILPPMPPPPLKEDYSAYEDGMRHKARCCLGSCVYDTGKGSKMPGSMFNQAITAMAQNCCEVP
jgi:hypothetical protein